VRPQAQRLKHQLTPLLQAHISPFIYRVLAHFSSKVAPAYFTSDFLQDESEASPNVARLKILNKMRPYSAQHIISSSALRDLNTTPIGSLHILCIIYPSKTNRSGWAG
jgi:hypothetical protein